MGFRTIVRARSVVLSAISIPIVVLSQNRVQHERIWAPAACLAVNGDIQQNKNETEIAGMSLLSR